MRLVSQLNKKREENVKWPIDCLLPRIDEFEEILILAKRRDCESYVRFSTSLKSTFWWMGVMEAMKHNLANESLTHIEGE